MMGLLRKRFDIQGTAILAGLFTVLFILESRYRLRKRVQNRWQRIVINSAVATPSFIMLRLLFLPAMVHLAKRNQKLRWGFSYLLPNKIIGQVLAFLLLDYTNYLWHVLNHKVPLLWRFHLVHHTDKDLDLTTAFRFHFGELIGSIIFRGLGTFFSGVTPLTVVIYEIAFEAATEFHHSNTRLPLPIERVLNSIVVTPRMHGIHHSVNKKETNSNYSVIFSFWDRLHRTLNLNVRQSEIIIGVPDYPDKHELTIAFLLKLPFTTIRRS